ncbi:MAG: membrane protein insertase YidC [Deltaproteobacteria bacterium]|jgi:YidC/Oxa1 family membrane protein insertase|nr:membrane protein insertase YidC [Deltaproteobacteria bacterium]
MQEQQQTNPFNSRFLMAMIIFALFYFGWNSYLQKKYPDFGKKNQTAQSPQINTELKNQERPQTSDLESGSSSAEFSKGKADRQGGNGKSQNSDLKTDNKFVEEKKFTFENKELSFEISNKGMGLVNLKVNSYTDKENKPILLGQSALAGLFEFRFADNKIVYFEMSEIAKGHYKGIAKIDDLIVNREIIYNESNNSFDSQINLSGLNDKNIQNIKVLIPEKINVPESQSWLFPSYEHQDFYVSHASKTTSVNFSSAKENLSQEIKTANILSVGNQYFATAILDKSDLLPDAKLNVLINESAALGELVYPVLPGKAELSIKQVFYAGPKSITILSAISDELTSIINFGWLGFIAKPLLFTMKWFYAQISNWGVAIILLTLLVRLFVLPFNLMSMKSMKAMQKIQPEMTAIREKYKEDPIRMNQEIMSLMKVNKANPFGGCLPMLLQIPIFFALYRVIGSSIELYQSPFMLWITDLSSHDKFYVLPVLMGATMFTQQKITPTNMDPAQAKILLYMPLVMSVFMLNLPSGLTLYMFVSGLFGITQQYFMLKSNKAVVTKI